MFEKWRVGSRQEIWTKGLVVTLFVFSGAVFTLRGPFRALSNDGLNDLISPYVQSTAWVHGADPYSPQSLLTFWPKGVARPAEQEFQDGCDSDQAWNSDSLSNDVLCVACAIHRLAMAGAEVAIGCGC